MKTLLILIIASSLSFNAIAEKRGNYVTSEDVFSGMSLSEYIYQINGDISLITQKYENFVKSDFPNGSYCETIGDDQSIDRYIINSCLEIVSFEASDIMTGQWANTFKLSFEDEMNGKVFLKRYRLNYLDQICDLWISFNNGHQPIYDVYCD